MRHHLIAKARKIAADVRNSEDQYDLALADTARLVANLLDARRTSGVPARTGRAALDRALQAISHGAKARESLLDMHAELARLDLRELAVGDVVECPEDWASNGLQIVASRDAA